MSNVMVGDVWTKTDIAPPHPGVVVTSIDGPSARFADGGGWVIARMTAEHGWKRIVTVRELAYQARIVELTDALASVAASGVANTARYAGDLAAARLGKGGT